MRGAVSRCWMRGGVSRCSQLQPADRTRRGECQILSRTGPGRGMSREGDVATPLTLARPSECTHLAAWQAGGA
eukprot:1864737-Pyramimonas_sp.AAC.1